MEERDEDARTQSTHWMVPIADHHLGPAGISRHWGVLSDHGAYGARPWLFTLCAVSPVPADDALHARWAWRSRWPTSGWPEPATTTGGRTAMNTSAYGLWPLVVINAGVFIIFAFSFARPQTGRDWRSFGAFSAFIVALFTEMYGFPLTIYLLSGWLSQKNPGLDPFSHDAGHLWSTILGLHGDPHFSVLHILSLVAIFGGFILLAGAWSVLYDAQRRHALATAGVYSYVRHPQYVGFVVIMLGFLLQWPTLLTLLMFPILVFMYVRLARTEEAEALREFGDEYRTYVQQVPGFIPRLTDLTGGPRHGRARES